MLTGTTIAVTAERRAHQQVKYLESRGASVRWVPVLRTVDGADRSHLHAATERIASGGLDVLVAQTGQGLTWWLDTVPSHIRPRLDHVLANAEVMTRGPKATSAARRNGLNVTWQAPSETTNDVVAHLDSLDLTGCRCAIVFDGNDNSAIIETARQRGADVVELPIYRYAVPDRTTDIEELIRDIIAGNVDVVTFTASPAIRHLRSLARDVGNVDELDAALTTRCRPAVVGPVCAATAREANWGQIIEPATARLIPMLDAVVAALAD